jgi:hypothetical protein
MRGSDPESGRWMDVVCVVDGPDMRGEYARKIEEDERGRWKMRARDMVDNSACSSSTSCYI